MLSNGASVAVIGCDATPLPRREALGYVRSIGLIYLFLHVVTWSFLPMITSNSINRDTVQIVYWGHELGNCPPTPWGSGGKAVNGW